MALSQKHSGKQLVPWYSKEEWLNVYDKLYGQEVTNESKNHALEILHVWESRTKHIPAGVHGTIVILDAQCNYVQNYKNRELQMLISGSICRFLNICVTNDTRQGTFYALAKKMNVPNWLINLRHEISHGQTLPTLNLLNCALKFSFEWLYNEYWSPVRSNLQDFKVCKDIEISATSELKQSLEPLVYYYSHLCLNTHPHWSHDVIADIANEKARQSLIYFLQTELNYDVDESTRIQRILEFLWRDIYSLCESTTSTEKASVLVDLLFESKCFFCEIPEYKLIFLDKDSQDTQIAAEFLVTWEKLIRNFHRAGFLSVLIEKLVKIAHDENETKRRRQTCALWLVELAKAVLKCRKAQTLLTKSSIPKNASYLTTLMLLFKKCENNESYFTAVINLSLFSDLPNIFKDWTYFQSLILSQPNEYTMIFLAPMLKAHLAMKTDEMIEQIVTVTKVYLKGFQRKKRPLNTDNFEIYVVKNATKKTDDVPIPLVNTKQLKINSAKRFRKAKELELSKCPLGVLSWQTGNINPIL